ncbi:MAG: diacylglycerol kinase family lipid kinase [Anaerolineae bacterium]|nr:diacylglycerol kinase family lipid kinase [Anaerolineae bacterium]
MRYKVIVNPIAGKGYAARAVPQIESLLREHGLDYDLVQTQWPGEAIDIARQAVLDGYDTIVAAGGDGTYQEVVNGMLSSTPDASVNGHVIGTLGILPVGSGCDLSWAVGTPSDLPEACAQLARHETRVIDVARLTIDGETRFFDNTLGIGFEGVVNVEASKVRFLRGMALYLPVVLKSIFLTLKPVQATISYQVDGEAHSEQGTYLMVDVCNGSRAGGAFFVAPHAQPDDGLLDICVVEDIPRMRMLALLPHFLRGTHTGQADVKSYRATQIRIESNGGLMAHADGELVCTNASSIECEILPHKIRVIG